jgi:hypothetical protein
VLNRCRRGCFTRSVDIGVLDRSTYQPLGEGEDDDGHGIGNGIDLAPEEDGATWRINIGGAGSDDSFDEDEDCGLFRRGRVSEEPAWEGQEMVDLAGRPRDYDDISGAPPPLDEQLR